MRTIVLRGLGIALALLALTTTASCEQEELPGCSSSDECGAGALCIDRLCVDEGVVIGGPTDYGRSNGGGTSDPADASDDADADMDAADSDATGDVDVDASDAGDGDGGNDAGPLGPPDCTSIRLTPNPLILEPDRTDLETISGAVVTLENNSTAELVLSNVDAPVNAGVSVSTMFVSSLPRVIPRGGSLRINLRVDETFLNNSTFLASTSFCTVELPIIAR